MQQATKSGAPGRPRSRLRPVQMDRFIPITTLGIGKHFVDAKPFSTAIFGFAIFYVARPKLG